MKSPSRHSNQVKLKRLLITAIICGGGFVTGCGIPCLRGPQPGPATPDNYLVNNGMPFWNPNDYSTKVDESAYKPSDKDKDEKDSRTRWNSDETDADDADMEDGLKSEDDADSDDEAATLVPFLLDGFSRFEARAAF